MIEFVLTFFLVFVIFGVAVDPRGSFAAVAGIPIGLTISLDIMMGGPLTGASMNPSRTFGPDVVAGKFDQHLAVLRRLPAGRGGRRAALPPPDPGAPGGLTRDLHAGRSSAMLRLTD